MMKGTPHTPDASKHPAHSPTTVVKLQASFRPNLKFHMRHFDCLLQLISRNPDDGMNQIRESYHLSLDAGLNVN